MANEIATAYLALVPSMGGVAKTIEAELNKQGLGKIGESGGKSLGGGMARGVAAAGKAVGAAVTAAAGLALKSFADYEQLVGGVDTLYKDGSSRLQAYAADAYKTAGMSANAYMEQATSFAGSLVQALGGDTAKAADYANMAVADMSDNANKMGTDMARITDAYQGFAKQNFTMLDNLKLGYGGTKTEMERLLADATALSGVEYDISSYADIVEAIHVVQTEMGITGTTAEEAAETISGSVASMKAAWANWLTGLGVEDADLGDLTSKLVESAATAASNVLPRIGQIASSIGEVFASNLSKMRAALPELFSYVENAVTSSLGSISAALPQVVDDAAGLLLSLGQEVLELVPRILPSVFQAGVSLFQGLVDAVPTIASGLVNAVDGAVAEVAEMLPTLLPMVFAAALSLFTGISDSVPAILPTLTAGAMNAITTVAALLPTLVPMLLESAVTLFTALVDSLPVVLPSLLDAVLSAITQASGYLPTLVPMILSAATTLFLGIAGAVPQVVGSVLAAVGSLISQVPGKILSFVGSIKQAGEDLIAGMVSGITSAGGEVWDAVKRICSNALGAVKSFFGISSPSKVMREMFGYVGEGMVLGLNDKAASVVGAMQGIADDAMAAASFSASPSLATAGARAGAGSTTINLYCDIRDFEGIKTLDDLYDVLARARAANPARRR